ncbi:hypothetical protein FRD01_01890 [Microvenator marinus]|uniref:Uncharacterized protein n=1 Tax=Microvenator marinus TaxID=2600177 RepID=A0A5B8XLN4_9DELT|nr:hypothetical protein [Microvenator marinus]QED26031.1 hypothetical protein FRD01_01890 [Microvenator marinus]
MRLFQSDPAPTEAFQRATEMALERPGVFAAKVVADFALLVSRALLAFLFVVLAGVTVVGGRSFGFFSALVWAGWFSAASGILIALEAGAWALIWGQARSLSSGVESTYSADFTSYFLKAFKYRTYAFFAAVFIVAMLVSVLWGAVQFARIFAPSEWFLAASTLGLIFTGLALFVGWLRFSVELANVRAIVSDEPWIRAFTQSLAFVGRNPVNVYRVFIQALGALIAPLLIYYFAIFMQNLAVRVAVIAPVAIGVRILAEVLMAVGVAAFSILTSYGLLALWNGQKPQSSTKPRLSSMFNFFKSPTPPKVGFDELLPKETPHILDLDEVFAMIPPSGEGLEDIEPPRAQDFDLDAVLTDSSVESDTSKEPDA